MSAPRKVIDVVNLNADASCLSSKWWLKMLQGGTDSYFCGWLNAYVKTGKKISLGIIGATVADVATYNPEALDIIRKNPQIFEIILRPFAHDIALLRNAETFRYNLIQGKKTLDKEFGKVVPYFLPPEFMLTNEQVKILSEEGVEGAFINAKRFKPEIKNRLPEKPYIVKGLYDSQINCIPFNGELTQGFLDGIHYFNANSWNYRILDSNLEFNFCWRDGESSFFLPDGNEREEAWLAAESAEVQRLFLSEALQQINFAEDGLKEKHYRHYPVHSFTAWMKEFKMMGYVQRLYKVEQDFVNFDHLRKSAWLQAINSDVLSAIEKDSPVITIKENKNSQKKNSHTIWRSERGFEGEEFLNLSEIGSEHSAYVHNSEFFHIKKLRARMNYLAALNQ